MTCWASSLGNCGGGISREHIISKSQFDEDTITLQGLPWCKEPRSIGLASLVAKNLCRDHNTGLSPADEEARKLKHAFETMFHKPVLPVRVKLDARLIERWLLKTTINLALQEPNSGLEPTPELARCAFGLDVPPHGQGFFLVAELGENLGYADGIRFESTTRRDDGRMVIGAFVFHGVRALYALDGAPAVNGAIRARQLNMAPHGLKFRWDPELGPTDKVMLATGTFGRPARPSSQDSINVGQPAYSVSEPRESGAHGHKGRSNTHRRRENAEDSLGVDATLLQPLRQPSAGPVW